MDTLVTIILFIIIFCVLVVSHEFGHFLVARLNGIRVVEFNVGVGPKLVGFHRHGTEFCIRLLPFGGACIYEPDEEMLDAMDGGKDKRLSEIAKGERREAGGERIAATDADVAGGERIAATDADVAGEDGASVSGQTVTGDAGFLDEKQGVPFGEASVWKRIATVLAGPLFNFILAYLLALVVVWFTGSTKPVINSVMDGYPAAEAGLQAGDLITNMNGSHVCLASEIYLNTYINGGAEMTITYVRDGEKHQVTVTPKYNEEEGRYLVGFNGYGEYVDCRNAGVFKYALYEVRYGVVGVVKSLFMMISGNGSKDDIGGPVAMAQTIDQVKDAASPYGTWVVILNMMNLAMLLSVNLGIVNLLPFPAIDGGRLVIFIVEAVTGHKISAEHEGIIQLVGFILLVILMIFVTYNDIARLIAGRSL